MTTPRRIAIVGGGPAGLVAAWEILSRDENTHVTLYQMGWRLGGKLATNRNPDVARRIEEHGIHILFGAYENAFHVLRDVHKRLGTLWQDDFSEHGLATLMEKVDGQAVPWSIEFPRLPGNPGDALDAGQTGGMSLVAQATKVLLWLQDYALAQVTDPLTGWLLKLQFQSLAALLAGLPDVPASVDVQKAEKVLRWLMKLLKIATTLTKWALALASLLGIDTSKWKNRVRRLWVVADLTTAVVLGLLRAASDGLGVEDIDDKELRQWLDDNAPLGSLSTEASESAMLRMVYEVVFAYQGGSVDLPSIAAGTAVTALLRLLFDYRGAFVYRMKEGSEAVVNALYKGLLSHNTQNATRVEFAFFHRLDAIELSDDATRVEKLKFTRQATPNGIYTPLDPDGCWPDHPHYDQLAEGTTLSAGGELASQGYDLESFQTASTVAHPVEVQRRTNPNDPTGFDDVVLATSMGALKNSEIAAELEGLGVGSPTPAQTAFKKMLDHQAVVATQAAQLWFSESATDMGWTRADDLVGTFEQPFGNWADLSLTIAQEAWPDGKAPKHVAYLAGPLEDLGVPGVYAPDLWRAGVAEDVEKWIEQHAHVLWPQAYDSNGFKWSWLVDLGGGVGSARLAAQWFRANRNAAELYTLTPPGSTRHRIGASSGFANLFLAGDWTDNTFNVGAVEAAVMSGRQAARAVLGDSFPVYGEKT